jgi:regulation of enolase protein 1 (concanavalin A-like superfamily)
MQFRDATGDATAGAGSGTGTAPGWVRLSRAGDVFTAEWSTDGTTWTTIGRATVAMPPTVLAGLAVTSHNTWATAAASFDDVALQQP